MDFDFSFLKKSAGDVVANVRSARKQIEQLKRDREDIANAPLTKDDVKGMLKGHIAAQSKKYQGALGHQVLELARGCNVVNPEGDRHAITFANTRDATFGPMLLDRAFCGLFGTALYDSLAAMIDAMAWPAGSRPIQGREDALAEIDKRLKKLIEQEQSFVSAAAEVGLRIDHV